MSTATLERPQEALHESGPPCEINFYIDPWTKVKCGKPSVVRVRLTCLHCESSRTLHLCRRDFEDLKKNMLACDSCLRAGAEWHEI
jgi:hypothetical protein